MTSKEGPSSAYWKFDHVGSCLGPNSANMLFNRGPDRAAGIEIGSKGVEQLYVVYYNSLAALQIAEKSLVFPEGAATNTNTEIRPKGTLPPLSARSDAFATTTYGALVLAACATLFAI